MAESIRLLFEYRDGRFVPLAAEKVRMVAPHVEATRGEGPTQGRFVELRSAEGETVRAVRVGDGGPPMVEFPTGDEEQPFGRTEPPPGAILSIVIAGDERATQAVLVDVSPGRGLDELVRRDLAVLPLDDGDAR
jgi:hypothetical protein